MSSFYDDDTVIRFSIQREEELKEKLSCLPLHMRSDFDKWIRIVVKENIGSSHENQVTTITPGAVIFESRSLQLTISNIVSQLLTGDHIKGERGEPVEVTLIDSCTKEVVKSGPEASGRVEIVVLEDKDNGVGANEFENILVQRTEGNKSVRVGNLCLNLIEGTALLPMVSFARNKKWMKISQLRLQARFVDTYKGVQVKEALTEPFVLKDRRNEAYKKHRIPSLDDDVWRLYNIDRKGLLARSLIKAEIKTVRDFIVCLFLYPQRLEEIFDGANHAKSLKPTVQHAKKCPSSLKYCSTFDQKTAKVVFNVSGEVLGLYMDDQFLATDILLEHQKEAAKRLVISAFKNWGDVTPADEDQFVAKTEIVNDALDLDIINECPLFDNLFSDGPDPNPEFLPESLWTTYNEIYHDFESVLISTRLEPEPVFGLFGDKATQKNKLSKRWRMLFCVVTFTKRSLGDSHAYKKPRYI